MSSDIMAVVCPTVLAHNAHQFREQMERIAPFATRVQIDLTDGLFAKPKSLAIRGVWWPHSVQADLHLMYERPDLYLDDIVKLEPTLVIIHAEAEGSFISFAKKLHEADIKVGVALLAATAPDVIRPALEHIDHVLIFSGELGHFGGQIDLKLLDKVRLLKKMKKELEIGWDGGINDKNCQKLIDGGIDVLNAGGFIERAEDPQAAYATLNKIASVDTNR